MLDQFLDIVYPPVCGICGKLDKSALCNKCKIKLRNQAICKTEDYRMTSSFFDEHIYMFQYGGEVRIALLNYKFKEMSYIYNTFINFLMENEKLCEQIQQYNLIVPVPISKKRLKQRGYNQSGLIGKKMAKMLNIKYEDNVLNKIKDNIPQSQLKQEKRAINVQGIYNVKWTHKIYGKTILIVDDIFTTGNTVNECSKVLKQAGAENIGVFTIARD